MFEGINLEYKSEYTDTIYKTIVAFANTSGGKIFIGINNDGEVIGLENPDEVLQKVVNSIKQVIKPDLVMFTESKVELLNNKKIVSIIVERGVAIPYYLAEKGLKPAGVYVRSGSSSFPASEEHIRNMIKESDGEKFIERRSLNQDLTFSFTEEEFKKNNLQFQIEQQISLGIIDKNNQYTNLGLLLSDECLHTIKVAVFQGNDKSIFKSRKEFGGSLIKQLYDVIDYIDYFNKIHAIISKIRRIETRDYPVESIRESILNAITHRDYSFSGSTQVNVYDTRIEVVSLGGLVQGIELVDVNRGISQSRNEKLANVFYRLNLIEAYGTGIIRIKSAYKDALVQPSIELTPNSFSIILPILKLRYPNKEDEILKTISENNNIGVKEIATKVNLGTTQTYNILKKLSSENKIIANKIGKKIIYQINN